MTRTRYLAAALLVTLMTVACGSEGTVAQGSVSGQLWRVLAYPQDDEVCLRVVGTAATCTSIREDRLFDSSGLSLTGSNVWVVTGIARPEVATVRIFAGGQVQDVETVPLIFRADLRAFAAAFAASSMPITTAIFDAEGNALDDPLLPQ